jgi:hypothetical protein
VTQDPRTAWLQKLDGECPYQIVLPRQQLMDDSAIIDFLLSYVGKFDLYVEHHCPSCATALQTRWMWRSSGHALSQEASNLGSRVERAPL